MRWNCSMLSHLLLRQAQTLPLAPSTKSMTMLTRGTSANSAMSVLLPIPQIQLSRTAPQFQRSTSGGTTATGPLPDVFSMACSRLWRVKDYSRPSLLSSRISAGWKPRALKGHPGPKANANVCADIARSAYLMGLGPNLSIWLRDLDGQMWDTRSEGLANGR